MSKLEKIALIVSILMIAALSVFAALLIDTVFLDKESVHGKTVADPPTISVPRTSNNDPQIATSNANRISDTTQKGGTNTSTSWVGVESRSYGEDHKDKDHGKGRGDAK